MPELRADCPGCRGSHLRGDFEVENVPVVLNYRYATPAESQAVRRGQLHLRKCADCGLVFNATFDPSATPYDARYENTQSHSTAFQRHLEGVASDLADRYALRDQRVLEIGCGKGDFLKLLCRHAGATGVGYDTSCECEGPSEDGRIRFHRRYLRPGEIAEPMALIVCRHVVEHVPEIRGFFTLLFQVSRDCGNAPVYIETPDWGWIAENAAHWDVFYEHCNYFSLDALANIARLSGLEVLRHRTLFGDQYQALEVRAAPGGSESRPQQATPLLERAAERLSAARRDLVQHVNATYQGSRWAVWGAGAKGVTLVNALAGCQPQFVVDANPAKQGGYIAGTSLEIIAPEDKRLEALDDVLVVNPNYVAEIREFASQRKLTFRVSAL